MGVAKAALESVNRYVARDLGPAGIRCNLVSAGPLGTVAARGIPGFEQLASLWQAQAPLGWDVVRSRSGGQHDLLSALRLRSGDHGRDRACGRRLSRRRRANRPGLNRVRADGAACAACSGPARSRSRASSSGSATPRPSTAAIFRAAYALPLLAVLALLEHRRHGPRPWRERRPAVLSGVFLAVDLILWHHSIEDVGAGLATVLANIQVVLRAARGLGGPVRATGAAGPGRAAAGPARRGPDLRRA